ncbi:hypothetical protein ACHHRT_03330 [Desulfurivibrio sp. D14AmB]|uniref:hypothetical protein n=1 Tax=Desulfurivibrio sp. D14AmB TaxID=3374370 RepID=UPI00376EC372
MKELIIFLLASAFFAWVSRRALLNPRAHGFYRFWAWEFILALLLLAWGAFLKDTSLVGFALAGGASIALFFTALCDEAECRRHFGSAYVEYMKSSKRFLPLLF